MVDLFLVLVFITVLVLSWIREETKNRETLAKKKGIIQLPGPPTHIPIFGSLYLIYLYLRSENLFGVFKKLSKKYGKIVNLDVGVGSHFVIVEDAKVALEIMNSDDWARHVPNFSGFRERSFGQKLGLVMNNDESWREIRRYTMRTLKQYGFARAKSMEAFIHEELEEFIKRFDSSRESSSDGVLVLKGNFNISVMNILWGLMAGDRIDYNDPLFSNLIHMVQECAESSPICGTLGWIFPTLRKIPGMSENDTVKSMHKNLQDFFRQILIERRKKGHYKLAQTDFIDKFLYEIDLKNESGNSSSPNYYTDEQFIMVCLDLFLGGADTTANILEFALLYMILNPEKQAKVQEEIDRVIGPIRMPTLEDKQKMPYLEATMLEIFRHANVIPITSRSPDNNHSCFINGVHLTKRTMVIIDLMAIHMNEEYYGDPKAFRPERFLNEAGSGLVSYKEKRTIPFGFGTRRCIGEGSARPTFFLYFTRLLQLYKFSESPNHPKPTTKATMGFTRSPYSYHSQISLRN